MDMTRMLGPGEGYEADTQQHEERGHNPLLVLHLLLQGRYILAVALALVFGAAGAVAGYKLTRPTFTCMGMIRIRPVMQSVLFNGSGTMPMYEQFVKTQVVMLKSERCVDIATSNPLWLDGGSRSNSREVVAAFMGKLEVANDGEIIRVTYTDADAATAKTAVKCVIDAYHDLNTDLDPEDMRGRKAQLDELKTKYETAVETARVDVAGIAKPYTPAALENRYNYKLTEALEAESEWHSSLQAVEDWKLSHGMDPNSEPGPSTAPASTQAVAATSTAPAGTAVTLAAAPASTPTAVAVKPDAPAATATKPATTHPKIYTAEEIARVDGQMRDLLNAQRMEQSTLDQLMLKVGPNHPLVQEARKQVDYYQGKVTDYAAHWTPFDADAAGSQATAQQAVTLPQLEAKAAIDGQRYNVVKNEANMLGNSVTQIQAIEASQQQTAAWLSETKQKLEEFEIAAKSPGNVSVLSPGNEPEYKDKRMPVAAASGFGGGIFGFGIIVVWGLLDRRLRTIDQARMSLKQGMRVLGMLPSLPKNLEDPSAASFAALCVHHIRMLLQVMPRLDGHPAIAITSPSPGDGKTSLTMALALSYAASGKSTLLIDCDIVGAGLTRRVNAIIRRRIGQILIRENLLTAAELREALSAAQRTGRKLGEVLVDEGFVDADQLAKALAQQVETSVGLLDVMRGEVLEDCVAETGTPRLWILPIGSALAEHGATISPEGFRSVLDQARKRFDVILVDTGPIPGAIESSVATSQVDGVVLTVSRGEQGPLVKRAADHLRDIGGRALGVVFNRASPEDFSSSYSSMSNPSIPERVREKAGTDMSALGPVAAAVAGHQRSLKEGK